MLRYFRESIKKDNEKIEDFLNRTVGTGQVNFPKFAFSELMDIMKYG